MLPIFWTYLSILPFFAANPTIIHCQLSIVHCHNYITAPEK